MNRPPRKLASAARPRKRTRPETAESLSPKAASKKDLLLENADLRLRLDEATETLNAIRNGEVDALLVSGSKGEQVYTLKGAHEPYRILVESISEGALGLMENGVIVNCNSAFADMAGISSGMLIGRSFREFVSEGDAGRFEAFWQQATESEAKAEIHLRFDGRTVPVFVSANARMIDGACMVFVVVTDITERKRAEAELARYRGRLEKLVDEQTEELQAQNEELATANEELQESEKKYRDLFTSITEGFARCEIVTDADGRPVDYLILEVNPAWEKITGISAAEVLNRPFRQVIPDLEQDWIDKYGRVALTGEPMRMEGYNKFTGRWYGVSAHCPERGSFVTLVTNITERKKTEEALMALHADLERRVELRTRELKAANRALEREVSERKKAEEAQRVTAEAFRDLYNNAPCGYHSLDADGVFVQMNDTELKWLGYERHEVIGKIGFSDLLTPESKEAFRTHFPLFKERGEVRDLELKMLRKDRTVLPVLLSATAVRDGKGEFLMSRSTIFDISERKKAEAEVVRAAKLATLGELAASVAHEINNPLNSILNYAQILKDQGGGRLKVDDLAEEMLHEGTRIASIVRNMLSYAKESKPDKRAISVEDIVNNSVALCTNSLRRESIELRVSIEKGLPLVSGNLQELQQVMMNLISNARHALKDKQQREPGSAKVLEIRGEEVTEEGRPLVRISVRDNGSGIPAALIERVTEPFFTTKSSELGTGLGLSISRKILDDHQGRLTVESIEGQYTTISIELPAAKESGRDKGIRS